MRGKISPANGRLVRSITEWLLFAALAVASTYPLLAHTGTHLPQGAERSATVPLLNLWTMWWNVDRIGHAYRGYWDAPIHHPVPGIFAALEPQTVVGWLAWPLWQVLPGPAHVYDLLVMAFLTLNGWFSCQFLRRLRLTWLSAICGGAMVTLLPLVHWQLGVFQLVAVWGVIWTLLALVGFQRQPGLGQALHLAVAFAVTYSLCCYHGLFLSLLLLVCSPLLLGRGLRRRRTWMWGATAVAAALVLLAPILNAQLQLARQHPFSYPRQWIRQLSASPADYLRTPGPQLVALPDIGRSDARYRWPLSPGTLKISMACIGIGFGIRMRRRRRVSLMLSGIVIAAVVLSMGPRFGWGGISIHRFLMDYYPGFGHARNLFRFAFFVQIAVALLAAMGLHGLHVFLRRRGRLGQRPWIVPATMLLLGLLLACEAWPQPPTMYRLPAIPAEGQWISWLRDRRQSAVCLAFFPRPENNLAAASQPTAEWMYFQTYHARPMVNGYSPFVPRTIQQLGEILASFPNTEGATALREVGVTHVVYDRRAGAVVDRPALEALAMVRVVNDVVAGIEIWQLPTFCCLPAFANSETTHRINRLCATTQNTPVSAPVHVAATADESKVLDLH